MRQRSGFLVRVMGLEPIRHGHTPLKRACLPIPAHSQTQSARLLYHFDLKLSTKKLKNLIFFIFVF